MAGRLLNRRELRKQAEQAEQPEVQANPDTASDPATTRKKAKAPAARKPRKPRAKKAPTRRRARWGVFDASMKQVAVFDYNQREAADAKLADLLARNKGTYFMQIVKEPMPDPEPEEEAVAVE
jgi:hypothetical protein